MFYFLLLFVFIGQLGFASVFRDKDFLVKFAPIPQDTKWAVHSDYCLILLPTDEDIITWKFELWSLRICGCRCCMHTTKKQAWTSVILLVTIQRYVNYSCLNMLSTTSFPVGHIRNITILFFIFLFSWWASQCYIGLWSLLTSSDWSPKVYVLYCTMLKKSCLEHVGVNMPRFVRKQVREETKIIFVFGCNFVWSR